MQRRFNTGSEPWMRFAALTPLVCGVAFCLGLGACALPAQAQPAGFADAVLGRWDITVHGADGSAYPSWLDVRLRKESELMAGFVGRFGSMRHATRVEFSDGQLTVVIPAQYESGPKELVFIGRLTGDVLEGTVGDEAGRTIHWTARRAPALTRAAPVTWGSPIQLFNGRDLTGWKLRDTAHPGCWSVANGVMINQTPCTDIISERTFTDFKADVEFQVVPEGNSGVYLRGRYELQVSDGAGQALDSLRMGGVYGFLTPVVNAARKPGEWQSLRITLIGRKVTVVFNDRTIIDDETIPGITGGALDSEEAAPGPIMLQGDHTKVLYRKVEITPAR